ncbi:MAG: tRNA lysidine(34) synthetase TilS [Anaerolineae bacterium]|nr:tRNA lysidine(34) synthetase TilS [Anaerolineae bacterium]
MFETIRQTLQKFQLIPPGEYVVVGVSGGADSLALLHILRELAPRMSFKLRVATLDHQLRGEASRDDARFVRDLCAAWDIPVTVGERDVAALAAQDGLGIEAAARLARYTFLAQVAHESGAKLVAVAHHADDQAETILMHLLRGSGTRGLGGMRLEAPFPTDGRLRLIRPLLYSTRTAIEAHCAAHDLEPRHDVTNADTDYLRNTIRHAMLPYLATFNRNIKETLTRLADVSGLENEYFEEVVEAVMQSDAVQIGEQQIMVKLAAFRELHPALQRRLVMRAVMLLESGDVVDYRHVVEAVALAAQGRHASRALFRGGIQVRVEYDHVMIERRALTEATLNRLDEQVVAVPGETRFGERVLATSYEMQAGYERLGTAAGVVVTLRTRRDGDRFQPPGMQGHSQKVNRWLTARRVPAHERDAVPILCVDGVVAAVFVNDQWIISEVFRQFDSATSIYFQFLDNS